MHRNATKDDIMSAAGNEEAPWIELTEPKQFSRLLYTNPVCFLSTVSLEGKRNVMVISWLTATNNEGSFMCSMNRRRYSASVLLSGVSEFVLSVPVKGMEMLVRDVGATSGKWGSKFPQDHVGQELPKELQYNEKESSKRKEKSKRRRRMTVMGIPGLEAVPFGSHLLTPLTQNDGSAFHSPAQAFAVRGTVAHLKCTIYNLMEGVIDADHLLILARVTGAHVHPSFWDSNKNGFRPESNAPPYLTFLGSQEFGYVVTQPKDIYETGINNATT